MKSNDNKFAETPLKCNSSPLKKGCLEDYFPIGKVTFQGRAVKLWEGTWIECIVCFGLRWKPAVCSSPVCFDCCFVLLLSLQGGGRNEAAEKGH